MSAPRGTSTPPAPRAIHIWAPSFRLFGGGIAAFSRELALALARQGHALTLAGRDDVPGTLLGTPLLGSGGVPPRLRKAAFALRLVKLALRRRPRLIITTHVNFSPVAWLANRLLGIPYVVVAHGIDIHAGLARLRKRALRDADAVWAVSRWTQGRCVEAGVPLRRVELISNTVDEERFDLAPTSPSLHQRYGVAPGEHVLLTVARLDPAEQYKGYDAVLKALPALQAGVGAVRYLIAGAGMDRDRIERLADALGVRESVTLCGFVPDEDLPDLYRLADVFAMPSQGEGFGIVFLEALASGTPVLGGNRDGTPDALADGELGVLVDPRDPVAIAAQLQALLERRGRELWFDPPRLRAACLAAHGRTVFSGRIEAALGAVDRRAD